MSFLAYSIRTIPLCVLAKHDPYKTTVAGQMYRLWTGLRVKL